MGVVCGTPPYPSDSRFELAFAPSNPKRPQIEKRKNYAIELRTTATPNLKKSHSIEPRTTPMASARATSARRWLESAPWALCTPGLCTPATWVFEQKELINGATHNAHGVGVGHLGALGAVCGSRLHPSE